MITIPLQNNIYQEPADEIVGSPVPVATAGEEEIPAAAVESEAAPEVNEFDTLADFGQDDPNPDFAEVDAPLPEVTAEETTVPPVVEVTGDVVPVVVQEGDTVPPITSEVETPVPVAEVVAPVVPVEPVVAVVEEPVQVPPSKNYDELRADGIVALTEQYTLNEEQAELMRTDPDKALPALAASLAMDAHENMVKYVNQNLPTLVKAYNEKQEASTSATNAFFGEWPALNKPEYQASIDSISATHRQMNPTMSSDQFVRDVAAMAMIQFKIPFDPATGKEIVAAVTPAAIHRIPAGASAAPTAIAENLNEFEQMADDLAAAGENHG